MTSRCVARRFRARRAAAVRRAITALSSYTQASVFGYVHVLASLGMIAGSLLPGYIASLHTLPHTVLFPLFALAIAAAIAILTVLLVSQSHAPDSRTRVRPDDGRECAAWHACAAPHWPTARRRSAASPHACASFFSSSFFVVRAQACGSKSSR